MFNYKNIFGLSEIYKSTNAGIEQSYKNADDTFKIAVLELIKNYCEVHKGKTFTVNQLRDYFINLRANGIKTHDNRVVGAMMRRACKYGYCKKTGLYIKSKVGHYSNLQVWVAC